MTSTVAADSGGTVHLLGLVDNNLNATMVAYSGGTHHDGKDEFVA